MVRDLSAATQCFTGSLEPAAFHVGPPQEEALARLEWLVEQRGRCGLVVGAEGMGKSHLLAVAARRFAGLGAEVAVLSLGGLPAGEWLALLLDRLPLDGRSRAEPLRDWQKLENRLRENALMERTTVLVFDDLDRGPTDALEGIARLTAAVEPRFARLVVVATATPQGTLLVPEAIRQRATVRIDPSFVPGLRGQFGGDMMLAELDRPSSVPPEQPSIGPSDDGRVEVMIGGPSAIRIAEHLAGWGALIEVLEPDEVRDYLLRVGRELVQRYGASGRERDAAAVAMTGDGA